MSDISQHLAFIQNVISRMASNSLAVKSLTITLVSALIAIVSAQSEPKPAILIAGLLPVFVFWHLDAKYLHLERKYRKLYDAVRTGAVTDSFSMDVSSFNADVQNVTRIAVSWSGIWFYLVAFGALGMAYLLFVNG